jgi:D-beta-D-heptose 7-phosphate kinase/D-beta-D-heptose 1-phosphate adenosyltransferase
MPDISSILEHHSHSDHRFIPDQDILLKVITELKNRGLKIVLTQGVYDLIHEGHAKYLEAAKKHGDVLVVGIDSDELTRIRKGPDRPIVPEGERINMLIHLRHVDIVTLRDADSDIGDLIRNIKPDVLITSSSTKDFTDKMKEVYKDVCGEVITLEPQATTTTTARVRNLTIEGAEKLAEEIRLLIQKFLKDVRNMP